MESRAKILGHPIHQMLIPLPLGLLAMAVIFDVIRLVTDYSVMATVSYWMIVAGIISGLVAAPFGLIDWMSIPRGTRARSVGALHGVGNVIVLLLYAGSALLRYNNANRIPAYEPDTTAMALSFLGFGLAALTGWLGGELVDRLSVGVDEGAHLNSPSSLSGRPASETRPSR